MPARPIQLDIFRTSIPMRSFEHAAAKREKTDAIVVRLEYDDGHVGWGETLPCKYVTGETLDRVPEDIEKTIWPKCLEDDLLTASESPGQIPNRLGRRCLNAAACAVDIASLRRLLHDLHNISPNLMQRIARRPRIRTYIDSKVSGVLGSADPTSTAKRLWIMRWFGLTDFKLKLGLGKDVDCENLRVVYGKLRRGVRSGQCTLRVDVNGGWDADTTPERIEELKAYGVCVVEQPVFCSASKLLSLARRCSLPLMADESLLTERHAKTLLKEPDPSKRIWWNLRLSKNGGLLPTLELMNLAAQNQVPFTLGCMVGESSILSAAQRRVLQLGPVPRFIEGNYGRFLLADDLLPGRKSLRFGYAGALRTLKGDGLGINVSQQKVYKYGEQVASLRA